MPEILTRIFSHLDAWDLECGLRVCLVWRSALASQVQWLALSARIGSSSDALTNTLVYPVCPSLLHSLTLFNSAGSIAVRVAASAERHSAQPGQVQPPPGEVQLPPGEVQPPPGEVQPPPGEVQPPPGEVQPPPGEVQPPPGKPQEAQPALQELLSRAKSVALVLDADAAAAAGSNPRSNAFGHRSGQPPPHQAEVLTSIQALFSAGPNLMSNVQRLSVWGDGWLLAPSLAGLSELLPGLAHLDLAPDIGDGFQQYAARAGRRDGAGEPRSPLEASFAGSWQHAGAVRQPDGRRSSAAGWAPLRLAAAQALFPSLPPHLRSLSALVSIAQHDKMAAWAAALACLPSGLTSLCLLGPLCHSRELAAAVGGWSTRLPALTHLTLGLAECSHSHPDLEARLYDDPDSWTPGCWRGVIPALTQLRSLQLTLDDITEGLWRDSCSCSYLTCLRLHQTPWGGLCDAAGLSTLTGLQDLALTLGDCAELQELSVLTQLTRLELELLGIQDYCSAAADRCAAPAPVGGGLLHLVTDGLTRLRHHRLTGRSASVDPADLGAFQAHCPGLEIIELRAPFRSRPPRDGAAASACRLPPCLRALEIENIGSVPPSGTPAVRFSGLPRGLVKLSLQGVTLELCPEPSCVGVQRGGEPEGGGADMEALPPTAPRITEVSLVQCILRCDIDRLCGGSVRFLNMTNTTALLGAADSGSSASGSTADGCRALRGCYELRRLRVWGCRGVLRPFNDAALSKLATTHPRLHQLALNATAATQAGLAALAQLAELRSLKIAVTGQECAAALGPVLASLRQLKDAEVVLPTGGLSFVAECVRDHLARSLPGVLVRLRTHHYGE